MADASTFSTLYQRYQCMVSRALVHHGVPAGDVDDAVQEVFLVLLRKLEGCVDEQRLEAWLFEVSRRVASNHRRTQLRRLRKRTNLWRDPSQPGADSSVLQRECLAKFEGFLGELEPLTAKVFVLAVVEGLRAAEIAARLDVRPHKVYPRLRSARKMFAARFEAREQRTLRALFPVWMQGWGFERTITSLGRPLVRHATAVLPVAMLMLVWPTSPFEEESSMRTQRGVVATALKVDESSEVPEIRNAPVVREAPVDRPSRAPVEQAMVQVRSKSVGPRIPASSTKPRPTPQPTAVADTPALAVATNTIDSSPTWATTPAGSEILRGRVIDSRGRALEGATVYCQHRVGLRRRRCSRSTTQTDADGRFELPSANEGSYRLFAIAPGANTSAGHETFVDIASLGEEGPWRPSHLTLVAE